MDPNFLEFEQPIAELEAKIEELRFVGSDAEINITDEISRLQTKSKELTESIFASLKPWQISQLARHPKRPYTLDYLNLLVFQSKIFPLYSQTFLFLFSFPFLANI